MLKVWVITESNSGGCRIRGVYATSALADEAFDPKGYTLHHRAPELTVWRKPDGTLTVTIQECDVKE